VPVPRARHESCSTQARSAARAEAFNTTPRTVIDALQSRRYVSEPLTTAVPEQVPAVTERVLRRSAAAHPRPHARRSSGGRAPLRVGDVPRERVRAVRGGQQQERARRPARARSSGRHRSARVDLSHAETGVESAGWSSRGALGHNGTSARGESGRYTRHWPSIVVTSSETRAACRRRARRRTRSSARVLGFERVSTRNSHGFFSHRHPSAPFLAACCPRCCSAPRPVCPHTASRRCGPPRPCARPLYPCGASPRAPRRGGFRSSSTRVAM
jgi:hypothetical protein